MRIRALPIPVLVILSASILALPGCGSERGAPTDATTPPVEATPPDRIPPSLSGMYRVEGTTTVKGTGIEREIKGTVILAQEGNRYTATFSLATTFPTEEGPIQADVIGKGEGRVEGTSLQGTAETQIVMASVPGIDSGFAFVPRYVGPRIVSTAKGHREKDGTLLIEIESNPAEGEDYLPTRTTLRGTRVVSD